MVAKDQDGNIIQLPKDGNEIAKYSRFNYFHAREVPPATYRHEEQAQEALI